MAIAAQPTTKLRSANDLERLSAQGFRYELIEGELREMSPTGGSHGSATARLAYHVQNHVYERDLGECFSSEVGIILGRNPDTVLAPDFAFISAARMPAEVPYGFLPIVPDLVVETRSPGDTPRAVQAKMERWIAAGVRLAWDVDPRSQVVTAYQPGLPASTHGVGDTLSGGDVLPGLSLPVRQIFRETAGGQKPSDGP